MRIGVYPGSFDPVTNGHLDIIKRGSKLFDVLYVVVPSNIQKNTLFSTEERMALLKEVTKDIDNIVIDSTSKLTVDYAKSVNATAMLRGLRMVSDFEYELQIAQSNKAQHSDIETVFLTTDIHYSYLSSTIVREFASYGGDISSFVPKEIIPLVEEKYRNLNR